LKKVFHIFLLPLSAVYAFFIRLRNLLFNKGLFRVSKVQAKVISVGNLTYGGSGKTPATIYLLELLKKYGKVPGVLSRGYGRKTRGYLLVNTTGNSPDLDVTKSGDEMFLVADECHVAAAVSENRVDGAKRLIKETGIDSIVLDDAFQHRWIHRDINILMIDQRFITSPGINDQKPIPLGIMREGFEETRRADIILINSKFSQPERIPDHLVKHFEGKKVFYCYYENSGIFDLKTHKSYPIDEFLGQESLVICGIARPYSFLNLIEKSGISIKNKILFGDHRDYTPGDIQLIRKKFYETNSHSVLTTQKDAVKLYGYSKELDDIDIYYLKISLKIENEEEFNSLII